MTEILRADPAVTCGWIMPAPEVQGAPGGGCNLCEPPEEPCGMALCTERCTGGPCGTESAFAVERSDGASPRAALPDAELTSAEACAAHLADVAGWMIAGDENVRAVVAIRWEWRVPGKECPACGSGVRAERAYVPGFTGQPVSCNDDWHEEG